jgi:predicted transcriptional regulator
MLGKIEYMSKISILSAISERKGYDIFRSIATATTANTDVLITKLKLTRKQYYSRMSNLVKLGLVKRENGRYLLTSFGKVIFISYMSLEGRIDTALGSYWKLKAVDSLEFPSTEERSKITSILIDNPDVLNALSEYERNFLSDLSKSQGSKTENMLVKIPNLASKQLK